MKTKNKKYYWLFILSLILTLHAEVKLNGLFVDNAVLQQGMEVPIWGTAVNGESVTVEFEGQTETTEAKDGKWMIKLKDLKPGGPFVMKVTGGNKITLNNIMVGEVWVCSGQSNMERVLGPQGKMQPIVNFEQEAASADYSALRHYKVPKKNSETPLSGVASEWVVCTPKSVLDFTAVGYFFGSELHKTLKVPVGLIHASWGGTPAQAWTPPETLQNLEKESPGSMESPKKDEKHSAAGLYNGMINPLIPYAIRGVIWYQGEANGRNPKQYQTLFPSMISSWRSAWNQGEFPFLFVQIAPCQAQNPGIREAQFLTWKKIPNTAMAVITDCGDANDIHPPNKRPVGERLSLAARALAYGEKIEYSGPAYESMKVEGSQIILSFSHVGTGLMAKDGELRGFQVAGENKIFKNAKAEIKGETVVVSGESISTPVAVRYGWANVPDVNLYNNEGLPASPFRTDDWEK